jgi:hypothetical protein
LLAEVDPSVVLVTPAQELEWHGNVGSLLAQARCPDHHVVVAFEGRAGQLVDQLVLHCAPLVRAGDAIVPGAAQAVGPVGGSGGVPFAPSVCPADSMARGATVRFDVWVAAFGLTCVTGSLEWSSP